MKKRKKSICILLAVMLLTTIMPPICVGAQVVEISTKGVKTELTGNCGKKARWNYNADTQILMISGTGKISLEIKNKEIKENVKLKQITILGDITSPYSFIDEGCTITLKLSGFCKPMGIMSVYNRITVKLLKGNKSYIRKKGFIMSPNKKHLYLYTGKTKKVKIPNSIEIVEPGAVSWKKIVRMGKNIKQIKEWGFYYCRFDKLKLPEPLKRIESGAFSRSDIYELKINNKLEYIGAGAFDDTALKRVTINHDLIIKENNFPSSTLKYEDGVKKKTTIQQAYYWDRKKKTDKILIHFLQVEDVDGYEIYTRVRPYNYVNGKKVYGSWSSKYRLDIDNGFGFE